MAHGPQRKPLDFDGNLDHIYIRVRVRVGLQLWLGGGRDRPHKILYMGECTE